MIFSGEYDVTCKRQWSEELAGLCSEPNAIVDFSEVSYLDATCITAMLRIVRKSFDLLRMNDVVRAVRCPDDATGPQRFAPLVHRAFCGNGGTAKRNTRLHA